MRTTGLVWEQKTDDGSVHDKDNAYRWCAGVFPNCTNPLNPQPDGTAFTAFLGTLNNGTSNDGVTTTGCFAGHCDWRLPAIEELAGIRDLNAPGCSTFTGPCIDQTVFGPTIAYAYWSATTLYNGGGDAWLVYFGFGGVSEGPKTLDNYVRAVRSGL
jgi:uncharacterized protein DUF1566